MPLGKPISSSENEPACVVPDLRLPPWEQARVAKSRGAGGGESGEEAAAPASASGLWSQSFLGRRRGPEAWGGPPCLARTSHTSAF